MPVHTKTTVKHSTRQSAKAQDIPTEAPSAERLAKRIAASGMCSRRDAEKLIAAGRVSVNSVCITSPATNVQADDVVSVDNKVLPAAKQGDLPLLFMLHKPTGCLCTNKDPEGRNTVFQLLPKGLPRLVLVGRLDFNTEGLLLFTTSGALAQQMMLPATGLKRTYRVRVLGRPTPAQLDKLRKGVRVDGIRYRPMDVTLAESKTEGSNQWLNVTLTEGKNREVRKAMEQVGLMVNRLIRTAYGPFKLGTLPRGAVVQVPYGQVKKLLAELDSGSAAHVITTSSIPKAE